MSSNEEYGGLPFSENWYLELCLPPSGYEQEDNFREQLAQAQFNISLEPDEASLDDLELGPNPLVGSHTFTKRHTMPNLGASQRSSITNPNGLAQLDSNSPKRADTYPTTLEGPNIARQQRQRLIEDLLSKIDPETASAPPESDSQASDTTNVAQSLPIQPFAGENEWPLPTFLLDLIDAPTPPGLDRADDLTPDEPSPGLFNQQSQDIEHPQTNDCYSMVEGFDAVPPLISPYYHKTTLNSDSGIGSSIMHSRNGGKSSMGGSQAKASVVFDKGSISGGTAPGFYQKAAAMGPLKTPASYTAPSVATQPILSETALQTIKEIILDPILKDTKFCDFWHICSMAWEQMVAGQIGSLRDLEKFLFHKASNQQNNQAYDIFCKEFLSHVRESLKYMPENELLRSYDRPYDTGYWLDIMSQFSKSSIVMGISQDSNEDVEFQKWLDSTKSQPTKSQLGKRTADAHTDNSSLVKRVKQNVPAITVMNGQVPLGHNEYEHSAINNDDTAISQPRDLGLMGPPPLPASVLKSVHPPITAPLVRSGKARTRRRGSGQQQKELLLYRCKWDNCQHEPFTRACDLTKHEKTHTRPHKCRSAGCKYAEQGFPTEKEAERHWHDKHSSDTPSYSCQYPPCSYKSKRDSNCKQHMEKAHGYTYVRMKQNYKTSSHKRQNATSTSPTSQGSPTGFSPAKPDSSIMSPIATGYPTTGSQPPTMLFSGGMKEQLYSMNDLEKLRSFLVQHNQSHAHEPNLMSNFGNQSFTLPYPDMEGSGFMNFLPMPDSHIDPNLYMMDEEQDLTSYTGSDTVT